MFDAAGTIQIIDFTRADCQLKFKSEFLNRVKCKNAENTKKAAFKRHPLVPDLFKFVVKQKLLSLEPFTEDLVTVIMSTSTQNRPDDIGNILPCEIKTKRISKIKCDEPTGF